MIEWIVFGVVALVIVVLVLGDFRSARRRIPSEHYFHDRVPQSDIDQWKVRKETEEHERQLAYNLAHQQQPIPWQQVPKNPPPVAQTSLQRIRKRPMRATPQNRTTTSTIKVNMRQRDYDDASDPIRELSELSSAPANLFNGGDSTEPDRPSEPNDTDD